ncbi:MAG TPA: PEP-CTERM sorting domain-containing protein [Cellvibrionaceae bacterium]
MKTFFYAAVLFVTSSISAHAGLINANSFTSGQDVSHLIDNVTLSCLNSTGSHAAVVSTQNNNFVFASTRNAGFYQGEDQITDPFPSASIQLLELDFANPIRSFGVQSTSATDVGLLMFYYDAFDNYLGESYLSSTYRSPGPSVSELREGYMSFNFDVGKIRIGAGTDAHQILAFDIAVASVPEPSTFIMFAIGLLAFAFRHMSAKRKALRS